MKKSRLNGGIILFGIISSILFARTVAAVDPYLPDPEIESP